MIRALIFDLDDTLYRERDFVASGYRAVAEYVCARCGGSCEEIHNIMMTALDREGRYRVMPALLERLPGSSLQISELVGVYRRHTPAIRLSEGYRRLLQELRAAYRIGVVTDGNPDVQRAKCTALGLEETVDSILYTWEFGRDKEKPHPEPFLRMLDRLRVQASEALFIGDSLEKDVRGARQVGMRCVQVQGAPIEPGADPGQAGDFVVESLNQLPLILGQIGGHNGTD